MSDVSIKVDGVDITDDVIHATATFITMVNGQTGTCKFRIRDEPHDYEIIPGKRLTLDIDGDRAWSGYVMGVGRAYAMPVMPTGAGTPRLLQIDGVDINVLFKRRFVFNQADPTKVRTPLFPFGTNDTTMLNVLFDDWIDLSGDDLDTTTMVEHVGDSTIGEKARFGSGGWSFGQVVESIAMLPGAVYYIDPDRNFVFTDVDTPSAPYGMSDRPGPGQVGYREMEILKDGSKMVNDLLAIGFGFGSSEPVIRRLQDAASIAAHGRWQAGVQIHGVYKQATIDRIAQSYVYGSPQNKRGGKDDRVSAEVITYTPGFRAAQKVELESEAFGFTDVIPIRKLEITFPVPFSPRYKMLLSHEIDPPWSFLDNIPFVDPKIPEVPIDNTGHLIFHLPPEIWNALPGYPVWSLDDQIVEDAEAFPWEAGLSTPVRGDAAGPRVWWLRGYAYPEGIWEVYPPHDETHESYDGLRILWGPMSLTIRGSLSAATVTAGDTHLRVEVVLMHGGDADDEDIVGTYDTPNTGGGLRFFGDTANFEFTGVTFEAGDTIRFNVGIQGIVLIAAPSGRIGFFQPGWVRFYRAGFQERPGDGATQDSFEGDGSSQTFSTNDGFQEGSVSVTINGREQTDFSTDYANHTVTFDFAPAPDDTINIKYVRE